jgi:hypothetical protein
MEWCRSDGSGLFVRDLSTDEICALDLELPARFRALAAYKNFLPLWKEADPDILILKEAKTEYAKLHETS